MKTAINFPSINVAPHSDVAYFIKSNAGVIKSVRVKGSHVVHVTVCGSSAFKYADKIILKDCPFDWLKFGYVQSNQASFKALANTKLNLI